MSSSTTFTRPRTGTIVRLAAFVVAIALVVVGAIVAQGYDVKQAPVADGTLWVLNKSGANQGQYGRVDTGLRELDTVKDAALPSTIVQHGSTARLLTTNDASVATIDPAKPVEYASDSPDLSPTPDGTTEVEQTGDYVAYRTDLGRVYVARVDASGSAGAPVLVDPYSGQKVTPGAQARTFDANAVAVGVDGVLYAYSAAAGSVFSYDIGTGKNLGEDAVTRGPKKDDIAGLTAVGDTWVLFDNSTLSSWSKNYSARKTGIPAGTAIAVQQSSRDDGYAFVGTPTGLTRVAISDGTASTVTTAAGVPARPTSIGSERYAAWVPANSAAGGTLWSTTKGVVPLSFGSTAKTSAEHPEPVFRTNGSTLVLNEAVDGWVWTAAGVLVPSSQDWDLTDTAQRQATDDAQQVVQPDKPEPPVAVADSFGVRAGQLVSLPVLLNDSDPNTGDVLTIVPGSLTGLASAFGSLQVTNNEQELAIRVAAGATGSAGFDYTITDGGLQSAPAHVALTVVPYSASDTAPVLCSSLDGCSAQAPPTLQVAPGGSTRVNVLHDWYDPEGDPIYVESASLDTANDANSVAALPDGTVVFQNSDPDGGGGSVPVTVVVADSLGKTTPLHLSVAVTSQPSVTADSFALETHVGEAITVDPSSHVVGTGGRYSLVNVTAPDASGVTATPNSDTTTFEFSAATPGSYAVSYTVQSGSATAVAVARVIVLPDDETALTVAPITVFVRPKLDATVDVLVAVSNPGGKVLLLTTAQPEPADPSNSLVVDVVDHRLLRVKGDLGTGAAGVVGVVSYTVADSADASAGTVTGRATVVMLGSPSQSRPVAIDDSVVVRANTQVDVPVLDNDVAPDGNTVVLAGQALDYPAGRGLAFVSGDKVRILAPDHEDSYTITYTIYSAGYPDEKDTAEIHVTVRSPEGDNAPQPRPLEARVFAGETVSIPFDGTGVDPDGDSVSLDGIESQPQAGAGIATISSSGDAIVYTAPTAFTGVAEFRYRVTDHTETAVATVRVGVISAQSSAEPVTFSDYAEVTAGAANSVTIFPTHNDVDPHGAALTLGAVEPDEAETFADGSKNPEYALLASQISLVAGGGVKLQAGTDPGTKTYTYTVSNATSSSMGYIVLNVVRAAVPDLPVVTDSYVSIDARSTFSSSGIDVVDGGKVTWLSGDVNALTRSLWGDHPGYSVSGHSISGPLGAKTTVIPFQLAGKNSAGAQVVTYGFLTVPGTDDIIVALKDGTKPIPVKEDTTVSFDLKALVSVPKGDSVVVSKAVTAGQRAQAVCSLDGTVVTYAAHHGSPWDDACIVTVRLASQSATRLTDLVVPIAVQPVDAQPVLSSGGLISKPGKGIAPTTFDLDTLTTEWKGVPDQADIAALDYAYSPKSFADFDVSYDSSSHVLTVKAHDDAIEGRTEQLTVSYVGKYAGQSSTLTLTVGAAPTLLPKGGSFSVECTVSASSSCQQTVIGGHGEIDAFDSALTVATVQASSAACPGVTFKRASDTAISIDYPKDVAGGTCQISFAVKDAQGKVSPDGRTGTLALDLRGYPKPPASISQIAYGDGTIDLRIDPGTAPNSYPGVDHFVVQRDGKDLVECDASGDCPTITGLTNGKSQTYVAFTVNKDVGDRSLTSVQTDAYSYAAPTVGSVTAAPVFDRSRTTLTKGAVDLSITGSEAAVQSYEIDGVDGDIQRTGDPTTTRLTLDVGEHDLVITPISRFKPPRGDGPGTQTKTVHVTVAGLPSFAAQPATITSAANSLTVDGARLAANKSSKTLEYLYVAYTGGTPSCGVSDAGDGPTVSGVTPAGTATATGAAPSGVIGGLADNTDYFVVVCGSNGFGAVTSTVLADATFSQPDPPTNIYTFDVNNHPDSSGDYWTKSTVSRSQNPPSGFTADVDGLQNLGINGVVGHDPGVRVRYCQTSHPTRCSDWAPVVPAHPTTLGYGASVALDTNSGVCTQGGTFQQPGIIANPSTGLASAAQVAAADVKYYKKDSITGLFSIEEDPVAPDYLVPADAEEAKVTIAVTWSGVLSGLDPISFTATVECTP